jgi:hypothetical protein
MAIYSEIMIIFLGKSEFLLNKIKHFVKKRNFLLMQKSIFISAVKEIATDEYT